MRHRSSCHATSSTSVRFVPNFVYQAMPAWADRVTECASGNGLHDKHLPDSHSSPNTFSTPRSILIPSKAHPDSVLFERGKRSASADSLDPGQGFSIEDVIPNATEKRHALSGFVGVVPPPLIYPKSMYVGHQPCLQQTKERIVLKEIVVSSELFMC